MRLLRGTVLAAASARKLLGKQLHLFRRRNHFDQGHLRPATQKVSLWTATGSIRQAHDERQGDVDSSDVSVLEMADLVPEAFSADGDRLVGHDL